MAEHGEKAVNRRRTRGAKSMGTALSVAFFALALIGLAMAEPSAVSEAKDEMPKVIRESATAKNSTVTRTVTTNLPGGGTASASATASASHGTAHVSVEVESGEDGVRATIISSSSSVTR
jgi:hypothetical protein